MREINAGAGGQGVKPELAGAGGQGVKPELAGDGLQGIEPELAGDGLSRPLRAVFRFYYNAHLLNATLNFFPAGKIHRGTRSGATLQEKSVGPIILDFAPHPIYVTENE